MMSETDTSKHRSGNGRFRLSAYLTGAVAATALVSWLIANLVVPTVRTAARDDAERIVKVSEDRTDRKLDQVLLEVRELRKWIMEHPGSPR